MVLTAQIIVISYLFTLSTGIITSGTEAYFYDNSQVISNIQAGSWENVWDKSSFKFLNGNTDQVIESCDQKEISVTITNMGSNMEGPSRYEVYYISKGNPKDGEKVAEGVIQPITANQSGVLKFTASDSGAYKFRAFQRPFHANKPERQDLWSETITITCQSKSDNNSEQTPIVPAQDIPANTETTPTEAAKNEQPVEYSPSDSNVIKEEVESIIIQNAKGD